MRPLLGVLDTPIHQPRVDLGVGAAPRDGHEQAAADVTHLPLDLALLPARTRSARHRLHQMVGAQLQKAPPVVGALLAHEHHAHRRLHVVVDAPPADPAEEVEGPFVRLEHHLLALAREDLNQLHAAVAEPHVRCLHLGRHTRQARVLVAPVELVGLAGIEAQRHKTLRRRQQPPPPTPGPGVAAHRVRSRRHSPEPQGLHESAAEKSGPGAASSRWPQAGAPIPPPTAPASAAAGSCARSCRRSHHPEPPCAPCSSKPSNPGRSS